VGSFGGCGAGVFGGGGWGEGEPGSPGERFAGDEEEAGVVGYFHAVGEVEAGGEAGVY